MMIHQEVFYADQFHTKDLMSSTQGKVVQLTKVVSHTSQLIHTVIVLS